MMVHVYAQRSGRRDKYALPFVRKTCTLSLIRKLLAGQTVTITRHSHGMQMHAGTALDIVEALGVETTRGWSGAGGLLQIPKHIDLVLKLESDVVATCEKLWASYNAAHKEIATAASAGGGGGGGSSLLCLAPLASFARACSPISAC